VNSLLKDIREVVDKETSEVSDHGFARLRLKIKKVHVNEDAMAKEVFDLQKAHRQHIKIGQLGPKGKAQYEADLLNTQVLTRLTVVSKKRKKDPPNNPGEVANIVPISYTGYT
jgi:hypothetical protein